MRWIRRLCLALAAACLLSGCSMAPAGVDELLRAPQLTGEQSQVQKALTAYLGEAPQLKYPTQSTGGPLSPFVFGDWNGDGRTDAAVFYVSAAKGQNVHVAVLEQQEGAWAVTQEKEGLATTVESIATASIQATGGTQLLVGYASASGEKYLAVYDYQQQTLSEVLHESYSQYELRDITGSGANDLVIISSSQGEGMQLKLFTAESGRFISTQQLALNPQFTSCEGLYSSLGEDGSYYLVLDGQTGSGVSLASAILYYDARLQQLGEYAAITETDLYNATQRYSPLLRSQDIDGDGTVEIPRQIDTGGLGALTVNRLSFIAWMDYTSEYEQEKSFGVADLEYGYYLELPDALKGDVMVTDGDLPDSWQVRSADGETLYLTVRVTAPGVEGAGYFRLGNIGAQKVQARIGSAHASLRPAQLAGGFVVL